jgi:hypothetical protein
MRIIIIAIWLLLFLLFTYSFAIDNSLQDKNTSVGEKLIRSFTEFWSSKDLSQLDRIYTSDVIYEDVPDGTAYEGIAAIKKSLTELKGCYI